jgi:hypothetical protein
LFSEEPKEAPSFGAEELPVVGSSLGGGLEEEGGCMDFARWEAN